MEYIHNNTVEAGIVENPEDYRIECQRLLWINREDRDKETGGYDMVRWEASHKKL